MADITQIEIGSTTYDICDASARNSISNLTPSDIGAAASTHNHAATDITSGVLATARGGTGVDNSTGGTANTVFARPNGAAGAASFRALVAADIPNLSASKITSGTLATAQGGTGVDNSTGGTANTVFARPNGAAGAASFRALVAADIPNLSTSKITSGQLGIARGGTGKESFTAYQPVIGGTTTTGALQSVSSTNTGAFYRTSTTALPVWGTLPIAQGGTGATSASDALTNLGGISLSDPKITDISFRVKSTNIDRDGTNPSTSISGEGLWLTDQDDESIGFVFPRRLSDGTQYLYLSARNENNGSQIENRLGPGVNADGSYTYYMTSPSAFRDAIGLTPTVLYTTTSKTGVDSITLTDSTANYSHIMVYYRPAVAEDDNNYIPVSSVCIPGPNGRSFSTWTTHVTLKYNRGITWRAAMWSINENKITAIGYTNLWLSQYGNTKNSYVGEANADNPPANSVCIFRVEGWKW